MDWEIWGMTFPHTWLGVVLLFLQYLEYCTLFSVVVFFIFLEINSVGSETIEVLLFMRYFFFVIKRFKEQRCN